MPRVALAESQFLNFYKNNEDYIFLGDIMQAMLQSKFWDKQLLGLSTALDVRIG